MYVQQDTQISQQQVLLRGSKKPQDVVGTNHPNKAIKKKYRRKLKLAYNENRAKQSCTSLP